MASIQIELAMELRRFYVNESISGEYVSLTGEDYIHATRVLRFKPTYKLIVCDGSGFDYYCEVLTIDKEKVCCKVIDKIQNNNEHGCKIVLCIGLIKSERFDMAIQKAVELGVNEIYPFISENTSEKAFKEDRIKRIVLEACKQCGRAVLPIVHKVSNFNDMLLLGKGLKLFAYEKEDSLTLKACLEENPINDTITYVVGSEGGFTQKEVELAIALGFKSVTLGNRILRAETASIAGLSYISMYLED